MVNRKVKGTVQVVYNNINFKSTLEKNCYIMLEKSSLEFTHEADKFDLWLGFRPSLDIWAPSKVKGEKHKLTKFMEIQTRTFPKITYTPDFTIKKGTFIIYIDSKGNPNDVYPYKKKVFLKMLQEKNDGYTYIFMEPHNLRQMNQAIEIIRKLDEKEIN